MIGRFAAVVFGLLAGTTSAIAQDPADFYRGRSVTMIIGYGPGGGYDVYGRLVARYLGKYIPGNPSIIVQNMPGAGSLAAANHLYGQAPKDGTAIGTFSRYMALIGILGSNKNARFDPSKYTWLGSSSSYASDAYFLFARKDAAVKSLEDLRKPGGPPLVLGGTGEGSSGNDVPILLRDILKLNIKLVAGYPDSAAIEIAVERKELDGKTLGLSSARSTKPEWLLPNGHMQPLIQFARVTRLPEYPNVPTARELAPDGFAQGVIELAELPYLLSRPFAAPPDLPAERAKALQAGFIAVHADADYLLEAKKLEVEVSPIGGDEVSRLIERIAKGPKEQLDYLRKLYESGTGG